MKSFAIMGFIAGRDLYLISTITLLRFIPVRYVWAAKTPEDRRKAILQQYAFFWGSDALNAIGYDEHDWTQEEYSKGAFSCSPYFVFITS